MKKSWTRHTLYAYRYKWICSFTIKNYVLILQCLHFKLKITLFDSQFHQRKNVDTLIEVLWTDWSSDVHLSVAWYIQYLTVHLPPSPSLYFSFILICVCSVCLVITKANLYCSCPAQLRVVISTGDLSSPCRVTFVGRHNHSLSSAALLSEFTMSTSTKEEFWTYFEQGKDNSLLTIIILIFFWNKH